MADATVEGIGTIVVTQIGLIVRDIEKTSRIWADVFGVPVPAVMITDGLDKAHTEYKGKPSTATAKLAFLQFGQVSIEFIQPDGTPSTWQDFLDEHGEGVHHIAFNIKGMPEQIAYLTGKGIPLIQRGDYTGGRYAYLDGEPRLKVILELLENFN